MATIHQVLTADEAKALQAFRRMQGEQEKIIGKYRGMGRESRRTDRSAQKLLGTFGKFATALGVGGGIAGSLQLVRKVFSEIDEITARITGNVKTAAQDMAAFAMMQGTGQRAQRAAETVVALPQFRPGQALSFVNRAQAQFGSYRQGLAAAQEIGLLSQVGVPPEAAAQAVITGAAFNLTPRQAATLPFAAGEMSALSAAEMAQAAGVALGGYQGVKGGAMTAYQVMAILSAIHQEPGRLGTYTQIAARATRNQELLKNLGIETAPGEDVDLWQIYGGLQSRGADTPAELRRFGISEERELMAWTAFMANPERVARVRAGVAARAADSALLERRRGELFSEIPSLANLAAISESENRQVAGQTVGARAAEATGRTLTQTLAAEFIRRHYGGLQGILGEMLIRDNQGGGGHVPSMAYRAATEAGFIPPLELVEGRTLEERMTSLYGLEPGEPGYDARVGLWQRRPGPRPGASDPIRAGYEMGERLAPAGAYLDYIDEMKAATEALNAAAQNLAKESQSAPREGGR